MVDMYFHKSEELIWYYYIFFFNYHQWDVGLAALWIAWTIMASYVLYETISITYGSKIILHLFLSIGIVIMISLFALMIYQKTKKQIKELIDREIKEDI